MHGRSVSRRYFVAKSHWALETFTRYSSLIHIVVVVVVVVMGPLFEMLFHWKRVGHLFVKVDGFTNTENLHKFVNWMQMNREKEKPTWNCLRWLIANLERGEKRNRNRTSDCDKKNIGDVFDPRALQLKIWTTKCLSTTLTVWAVLYIFYYYHETPSIEWSEISERDCLPDSVYLSLFVCVVRVRKWMWMWIYAKPRHLTVMVHIKINELPKWKQLKAPKYIQNNE